VRAGEIVGIAGVEGNGQTELIEALAGLIPAAYVSGSIAFEGRDITQIGCACQKRTRNCARAPKIDTGVGCCWISAWPRTRSSEFIIASPPSRGP